MNLQSPTGILRIEAPFYVAASIWERGRCTHAAPILQWMVGKRWVSIHRWLFGKGYDWAWVKQDQLSDDQIKELANDNEQA